MGGWGSRVLNKYMEFCPKNFSFFQKKIKCSKQPKKQNKLNFDFSLSGVPNVRGGWVGSDVWDKVPKKTGFFDTFPKINDDMTSYIISSHCLKNLLSGGEGGGEEYYDEGNGAEPGA